MKQKSIKTNFIMNAILTLSSFIFPILTFPYISRTLLPVGSGKVSFAASLIQYFNMFAQLGIPVYGIRICAKVRDNKEELTRTAHELLFINFIVGAFSYICLSIGLLFVPRLQEDRTLYLIMSCTILLTAIGMNWLYQALEQYTYITLRSLIFKVIAIVAMFMLVHAKEDYVIYGAISIFASSASNICNFVNVRKYIDLKPIGNYNLKRHIKPILVFFAMSCATTIYTNLDTVMLGFMKTDEDVGYYNAAVKIKSILISIVTSLGTVLLPRASYYIQQKKYNEFKLINKKALNFVALLACPLTLYFILFAKQGIFFLSGEAFTGAVIPMQIIMPTLLFVGITNVLGIQILIPLGREKIVLYSEIGGAVVDLILNLMLIPRMSAAGAAIGTMIAELVVLIIQVVALRKDAKLFFENIHFLKILIALLIATVSCAWLLGTNISVFTTLIVSAILFFGVYCSILIFTKEGLTIEIINQILERLHIHFRI